MVSLRLIISVWMATALVILASITLSVTLTASMTTLRHIARSHAEALLKKATTETAALFDTGATQTDLLRNMSKQGWAWPSEDPLTLVSWTYLVRGAFLSAQGRISSQTIAFGDGTTMLFSESPANDTYTIVQFLVPPPSQQTPTATMNVTVETIWLANQTVMSSTVAYGRPINRRFQPTAIPPNTDQCSYLPEFTANLILDELSLLYTSFCVLPRHPLQATLPTFGTVTMSVDLGTVSRFLADARSTANIAAFALNSDHYIVGVALPDGTNRVPFNRSQGVLTSQAINTGCANLSVYHNTSVVAANETICLVHRRDFNYQPLRLLPDSHLTTNKQEIHDVSLGSSRWYVATQPVCLRIAGLNLTLVLVMPEKDVVGDVTASRNIAIGVSAGVVVLMATASFMFVVVMLNPLTHVAARMLRAATFDAEPTQLKLSKMKEVQNLQDAYVCMNQELTRIRSFVPQSVLQAGRGKVVDDTYGENELDDDPDDSDAGLSAMAVQELAVSRDSRTKKSRTNEHDDNRSVDSRRSKRSSAYTSKGTSRITRLSAPAVVTSLDCSLRSQNVSVVVANCNGFLALTDRMNHADVVGTLAHLVSHVLDTVQMRNGVLAYFHGDHFAATFNAVRPCPTHARNAVATALAVTAAEMPDGAPARMSMRAGVSTGKCLIGNVGTVEAKAYSVIGPAFTQALVLERLTRVYTTDEGLPVAALATQRTCEDAAKSHSYEYVDLLELPCAHLPVLVGRLVGPKETLAANQHEWLYVVDGAKTNDPHAPANAAMSALAAGRLSDVGRFLDSLQTVPSDPTTSRRPKVAPTALSVLEISVDRGVVVPSSLGAFYVDAFLFPDLDDAVHEGAQRAAPLPQL
jgi:class 3 adenylate cyclase